MAAAIPNSEDGPRFVPVESLGDSVFKVLADTVTKAIETGSNDEVPTDLLKQLDFIYGKNLRKAIQILEKQGVVRYVGEPSSRTLYQVQGSTAADHYLVLPRHYCSCAAFFFDVVGKGDAICCKHQLAARLAAALQRCRTVLLPDPAIAQLLMDQT